MPGKRRKDEAQNSVGTRTLSNLLTSPPSSSSPPLPEWFHECKSHKIFQYDTNRFPFRELLADWLEVTSDNTDTNDNDNDNHNIDLETIHTLSIIPQSREPLHPLIRHAYTSAKIEPKISSTMRRAKKKGLFSSPQYNRLINTYRLFIREVVAPLCCKNSDENNNGVGDVGDVGEIEKNHVVYQCPPTTRVVFPNGNRTISMHCDKEYPGHQQAEINFWLPVTRVFGNNSLWVESEPNKGDFRPVELEYGQCLRFDGHDCRHYTVHNDTESCRVSIDFRVVPSCLCSERSTLGDFCIEETSDDGYLAYWTASKKQKSPVPSSEVVESSLSSVFTSLSLESLVSRKR